MPRRKRRQGPPHRKRINAPPNEVADNEPGQFIGLRFFERDGFLYFEEQNGDKERLCMPRSIEKEVFQIPHDAQHHAGFHRAYSRLVLLIYVRNMSRRLKRYIAYCPDCQLKQIKRHVPYGELMLIESLDKPFVTVAIDFLVSFRQR